MPIRIRTPAGTRHTYCAKPKHNKRFVESMQSHCIHTQFHWFGSGRRTGLRSIDRQCLCNSSGHLIFRKTHPISLYRQIFRSVLTMVIRPTLFSIRARCIIDYIAANRMIDCSYGNFDSSTLNYNSVFNFLGEEQLDAPDSPMEDGARTGLGRTRTS
jgi:hypothetical protein